MLVASLALLGMLIDSAYATSNPISQAAVASQEANYLTKVFQATNAHAVGFVIHDYSTVNHSYLPSASTQHLAIDVANKLGLTGLRGKAQIKVGEHLVELSGRWPQMEVLVVVSSLNHTVMGHLDLQNDTTVVIRAVSNTDSLKSLQLRMNSIVNALSESHITPQIDAYIHGTLPSKLTQTQTAKVVAHALTSVDAHQVEALQTQDISSVSAYSPQDSLYIVTGQSKMNLQVALHFDPNQGNTNVDVGVPFITDNY